MLFRSCIVDKEKTHLIHSAIAAGTSQYGMQTFDQSIFSLFKTEQITYEEALRWASNVDEFKLKVQGISTTADTSRDQMAASIFGTPEKKPAAPGRRLGPGDHGSHALVVDRPLVAKAGDGAVNGRSIVTAAGQALPHLRFRQLAPPQHLERLDVRGARIVRHR